MERNYIPRYTRLPFLSRTLISYMLQSYFDNCAVDSNLEALKNIFSILIVLLFPRDINN